MWAMPAGTVLLSGQEFVAADGDTIVFHDGVDESDPFFERNVLESVEDPHPWTDVNPDEDNVDEPAPWDEDADGIATPAELAWASDSQALKDWYWDSVKSGDPGFVDTDHNHEFVVPSATSAPKDNPDLNFGNYKPRKQIKVNKREDLNADGDSENGADPLTDGFTITITGGGATASGVTGCRP